MRERHPAIGGVAVSAPATQPLTKLELSVWPECDGNARRCHEPATYAARVHQLDCCEPRGRNEPRALTSDGAVVLLLCIHCLAGTAHLIKGDISNRLTAVPRGGRIHCLTCGRPIASLHDLLEAQRL
jgi:hypothetical protein